MAKTQIVTDDIVDGAVTDTKISSAKISAAKLTPPGLDTQIAFNSAGSFGSSASFVWSGVQLRLTATGGNKAVRIQDGTQAAGRVLTCDANGEGYWQAFINAMGSGTPGQIPVWTLVGEIGDSVITQLLGNIGIGTTNPLSLLSVGSSSQFQVSSTGNVSTHGAAMGTGTRALTLNDGDYLYWSTSGGRLMANATYATLNAPSGANPMRINYGGDFAAGTGGLEVYDGANPTSVIKFKVDPSGTASYLQGNLGINITTGLLAPLHVFGTSAGAICLRDTFQGQGKVLTSDANASVTVAMTGTVGIARGNHFYGTGTVSYAIQAGNTAKIQLTGNTSTSATAGVIGSTAAGTYPLMIGNVGFSAYNNGTQANNI